MKILFRILWFIPVPFLAVIIFFPSSIISVCLEIIFWVLTGDSHNIILKMGDYPPMKWVNAYFDLIYKL